MKKRCVVVLFSITLIIGLLLAGCQAQSLAVPSSSNFIPLRVAAPTCNYGGEVSSVEAIDANTVRFSLCKPDAAFSAKLASPIFAIQDQEYLNKNAGNSIAMSAEPNGTGPYRLKLYSPGQQAVLVPSTSYWGVPPKVQQITFRWANNPILGYRLFLADNADGLISVPSGLIAVIRDTKGLKIISKIGLNVVYLGINNKISPFDNVQVRQAVGNLVNRDYLVQNYFVEGSEVATQLVPSTLTPGFSSNISWYNADPAVAKDLLTQAGFDFSQHLTFTYPLDSVPGVDSPSVIAQELKGEFAKAGVTLDLKSMSSADLQKAVAAGTEMLYLSWFQADYSDGAAFLERPFVRDAALLGNEYPDITNLINDLSAIKEPGARQAKFDEINQKVKDLVPLIPIGHALDTIVVRDTITNLVTNAIYENYPDASTPTGALLLYSGKEPLSFWPADETDPDTFAITRLLYDTLLTPAIDGKGFTPLLAESWDSNSDSTEWTFNLRYNVRFSNSSVLDANDVVASFAAIWDAADPNHQGRTGDFTIFKQLLGGFIND